MNFYLLRKATHTFTYKGTVLLHFIDIQKENSKNSDFDILVPGIFDRLPTYEATNKILKSIRLAVFSHPFKILRAY